MNDKHAAQDFCAAVQAAEKLAAPWQAALVFTNILWAVVLAGVIVHAG